MVLTLANPFLLSPLADDLSRYYVNTCTYEAQWDKPTEPADRKARAASTPVVVATGQDSKQTLDASRVEQCLRRHVINAMNRNIAIADFSLIRKAAEHELRMPHKSIKRTLCATIIKETAVSDLA
jgi:hypothetical protein